MTKHNHFYGALAVVVVVAALCVACGGRSDAGFGNGKGLVLSGFPTRQQTTDYTCGCASAMMVMDYYGLPCEAEDSLAVLMHTHTDGDNPAARPGSARRWTDYGTSVEEVCRYFGRRADLRIVESSYYVPDSLALPAGTAGPDLLTDTARSGTLAVGNVLGRFEDYGAAASFFQYHLRGGRPVMVCWNAWGGHWTVCIGYDDNGTPDFYDDDRLLMADPYDSTDGIPDGLVSVGLVHFFYDWFCTMTPKPWQLQPFIVVESL